MELKEGDTKFLFLLSGSSVVLNSCIKFRTYLNLHLASVADQYDLKLPKCFTNKSVTCPYCYSPWSPDTTLIKLFPTKKLVAEKKHKSDFSGGIEKEKVVAREVRNKLVLKCKVCCKKSPFSLKKKLKVINDQQEIEKLDVPIKKKKKKKEKNCGLKTSLLIPKGETVSLAKKNSCNKSNKMRKNLNGQILVKSEKVNTVSNMVPKKINIETKPLIKERKLAINPYATKIQQKLSNKKKMLQLHLAAKEDKGSVKNTLKDFLNLVSR